MGSMFAVTEEHSELRYDQKSMNTNKKMDTLSLIQLTTDPLSASDTCLSLDKWHILNKKSNCQSDDSDDSVVSCTCKSSEHETSYSSLDTQDLDEGIVAGSKTTVEDDEEMYRECDSGIHGVGDSKMDKDEDNEEWSDVEENDQNCHCEVTDDSDNDDQFENSLDNERGCQCQIESCSKHGNDNLDDDCVSEDEDNNDSDDGDDDNSENDDESDDDNSEVEEDVESADDNESDNKDESDEEEGGGWVTEDEDKDDQNSAFDSDAEDNVPELPPRYRSTTVQSYPPKRVSSSHVFQRQSGHTEQHEDNDDEEDNSSMMEFLFGNKESNYDSTYYYEDDSDDEYNYLTCFCYCTGQGYAFPRRLPRTIREVVNFWENDFQVGDYIYPSIGSWEEKGLVPERYDDSENYRQFIFMKSLYVKYLGCNKSTDRWYRKYAGKTLSEIATFKPKNTKRRADSSPPSPVYMESDSQSDSDNDCVIASFFDEDINEPVSVNEDITMDKPCTVIKNSNVILTSYSTKDTCIDKVMQSNTYAPHTLPETNETSL